MTTIWEIIILSVVVTIVKSQYDYYRPDIHPNGLDYNFFRQPFSVDEGSRGNEIPGKAGQDYPVLSKVPETEFRCDRQKNPGYYGDPETGCQAFHICQRDGLSDSFLCPNGTIFNQEWLVCDWWYNFDCSRAENLYSVNEQVTRSMNEADLRLREYRSNSLRRFVNNRINGQLDSQRFRNSQNGFTPLNNKKLSLNGATGKYGIPGVSELGINLSHYKYNRGGSVSGRFMQRNGDNPTIFGVPGAQGYPGIVGYQRNLFPVDGTLDRSYLPPGK